MFTLTVQDETLYQRVLQKIAQHGGSFDDVLRELLDKQAEWANEETREQKLVHLIYAADDLEFTNPFEGQDASEIMRQETGVIDWDQTNNDDDAR